MRVNTVRMYIHGNSFDTEGVLNLLAIHSSCSCNNIANQFSGILQGGGRVKKGKYTNG